jgi:hypothetical protein
MKMEAKMMDSFHFTFRLINFKFLIHLYYTKSKMKRIHDLCFHFHMKA